MKSLFKNTRGIFVMAIAMMVTFVTLSSFRTTAVEKGKHPNQYAYKVGGYSVGQVQVTGEVIDKYKTNVNGYVYDWVVLQIAPTRIVKVWFKDPAAFLLVRRREKLVIEAKAIQTNYDALVYRC